MTAQELKNSILQLAIQGKLVKQDLNDEPASVLLEKIKEEREKLIKEKKIKREKYSEIYKDPSDNHYYEKFEDGTINDITEEIPFDIPDSWEWIRLNNIVKIITGFSFKSSDLKENNKIRVIRISDFDETGLKNNKIVRIDPNIKFENYDIGDNSILMAMTGGTVGKSFLIEHIDEKMYLNQRVACINSYSNLINISYIYNVIQSSYVKGLINKNKNSTNDNISMDLINNFLIPLPCYNEQKNITNKILSINPIINNYNNKYKKLESLNKNYKEELKKSILQYAIQGKLVKQDSNDESVDVLINKILDEKRKLIKTKQIKKENLSVIYKDSTDNQFYEKFDDGKIVNITDEIPFDIPENWCWTRMKNICLINPRNSLDDKLEVSFIPMTLIEGGYKNSHTFEIKKWKEIKSGFTHFRENDIGLAKITPCFQNRKSTIFSNLKNGYGAGTTELHILRPIIKDVLKEYIFGLIKSSYFIDTGIKTYNGTAGQQRIHKDFLPNFLVPIPNTNEQKRIVFKIKEIFDYIKTAE
ncbi:MAG: restriction endonuclease subunit S [Clostridia bacterium]|nr:restriction endonuclease subunit S [Clostridia bacterium]